MKQRKPIICKRCEKALADSDDEVLNPEDGLIEDSPETRSRYKEFAKKFCVCDKRRPSSEFTSSAQPPNLDDIEKRMK
jgi:hypothetical protein